MRQLEADVILNPFFFFCISSVSFRSILEYSVPSIARPCPTCQPSRRSVPSGAGSRSRSAEIRNTQDCLDHHRRRRRQAAPMTLHCRSCFRHSHRPRRRREGRQPPRRRRLPQDMPTHQDPHHHSQAAVPPPQAAEDALQPHSFSHSGWARCLCTPSAHLLLPTTTSMTG